MGRADVVETLTEKALGDGHLRLETIGRTEKVVYVAVARAERWCDMEEKVRAEFYAELIYKYGYAPRRIGVDITLSDRSPTDVAGVVVFHDDERRKPYAVIECKKDGISDAQFNQAIEQAAGNGNAYKFRAAYVGVVAGRTRKFLDTSDKHAALERDKNVVADLPMRYGKPPEYKYRKGISKDWQDIRPVSKGELIAAIKKCHQTLWGGGRLSPPRGFC
jgi:type I restriction enzyme M protein